MPPDTTVSKAMPPRISAETDPTDRSSPCGPKLTLKPEVSQNRVEVVTRRSWGASMKASAITPLPLSIRRGVSIRPTSMPWWKIGAPALSMAPSGARSTMRVPFMPGRTSGAVSRPLKRVASAPSCGSNAASI